MQLTYNNLETIDIVFLQESNQYYTNFLYLLCTNMPYL